MLEANGAVRRVSQRAAIAIGLDGPMNVFIAGGSGWNPKLRL